MHVEDPGYWVLYACRGKALRDWQKHLLAIYRKLRQHKVCAEPAAPSLSIRLRGIGPKAQPRAAS